MSEKFECQECGDMVTPKQQHAWEDCMNFRVSKLEKEVEKLRDGSK